MQLAAAAVNGSGETQTLQSCIDRRILKWPAESVQHEQRITALEDLVIESAYPVTMVDQPAFITLVSKLDPKFKMPRMY